MLFLQLHKELRKELDDILQYWSTHTIDQMFGGFVGRIDEDNKVIDFSPKGSVLNARILWTFAAAFPITRSASHWQLAERAFRYIEKYFIDSSHSGVYWTVDYTGNPLDDTKKIYAHAFVIYAMSEWYRVSGDLKALEHCIALYQLIRRHSLDSENGGYVEAFTVDWQPVHDLRLSEKDANEAKSMNTHLHILEAYANLYSVWPDEQLLEDLTGLLNIFRKRIIDHKSGHLNLFFDMDWNLRSPGISYGHDIEAGWLLYEAAKTSGDEALVQVFKNLSIRLTDAALEGMDRDGGLWYAFDPVEGKINKEKHWWPQAESVVGLFNAWQLTLDEEYLNRLLKTWKFIRSGMIDRNGGEWYWGVTENGQIMPGQDKVGIWKCPYHNGRACMELINRIDEICSYHQKSIYYR